MRDCDITSHWKETILSCWRGNCQEFQLAQSAEMCMHESSRLVLLAVMCDDVSRDWLLRVDAGCPTTVLGRDDGHNDSLEKPQPNSEWMNH